MSRNFLTATLAAGAILFVLGFAIYGLLLASFFESEAMRPAPAMGPLVLGHLFLGAFVALILGWKGVGTPGTASRPGPPPGS